MKTKYKKTKKNVTSQFKRKHVSTRRRQRGGYIINIDDPTGFSISDGAVYNIKEEAESYTFEGKAVAIVSFQTCGMNCENPPDVTYRALEGKMIMYDDDRKINMIYIYEGTFNENGDKINGTLIELCPTGIKYKKTTYIGPFEDNKKSGSGQMILEDGSRYTGDFINNKFNGNGRLEEKNGGVYTGEFKDDFFHGKGTIRYMNGDVYIGDFNDGKRHGAGQLIFEDGSRYTGDFIDNKFNGNGRLEEKDSVYTGEFKDYLFHGKGTIRYMNGDVYIGDFKDGKRHGAGIIEYNDGRRYEGTFKDGIIHDGKVFKFKHGRKIAFYIYSKGKGHTRFLVSS
jgi:hypothetical protein